MLQALALGGLILPGQAAHRLGSTSRETCSSSLSQVLLAAAVAMTLWSGWEFFREFSRQRGNTPAT